MACGYKFGQIKIKNCKTLREQSMCIYAANLLCRVNRTQCTYEQNTRQNIICCRFCCCFVGFFSRRCCFCFLLFFFQYILNTWFTSSWSTFCATLCFCNLQLYKSFIFKKQKCKNFLDKNVTSYFAECTLCKIYFQACNLNNEYIYPNW